MSGCQIMNLDMFNRMNFSVDFHSYGVLEKQYFAYIFSGLVKIFG